MAWVNLQVIDKFISTSAQESGHHTDFNTDSPLAGLGYGLPISRCYARHFGMLLSQIGALKDFCHFFYFIIYNPRW